ncbi:MAG: hypothetical protein HY681_10195 [Chloroflexi bacterium]|nr:hypothetical protein [Chloroflexota bacterium]
MAFAMLAIGGILLLLLLLQPSRTSATSTIVGNMTSARAGHTATLLPNGKALIAGGMANSFLASAELYDPATQSFTATGSMATARAVHTATLLKSGLVLITGGVGLDGGRLASAELYDPVSGTFSPTGNLVVARSYHSATLLPDGTVLIAGGYTGEVVNAAAEIYDPVTETFVTTGTMTRARNQLRAVLLPNGLVLIVGGYWNSDPAVPDFSELYDSTSGEFAATIGASPVIEYGHTTTLLGEGQVLIVGGQTHHHDYDRPFLYDPATGSFIEGTSALSSRAVDHSATLLPDGRVLISGGGGSLAGAPQGTSRIEIYDPKTSSFELAASLSRPRVGHTATLLQDGKVLMAGGVTWVEDPSGGYNTTTASVELYDASGEPPPPPTPTPTPTIPAPAQVSGTVMLQMRSPSQPPGVAYSTASVRVFSESFDTTVGASLNGGFAIPDVPGGAYTAVASAPGYLSAQRSFALTGTDVTLPGVQLAAGDVNNSGAVNINDITAIVASFGASPPACVDAVGRYVDIDCNGFVNINDITAAAANFGRAGPTEW